MTDESNTPKRRKRKPTRVAMRTEDMPPELIEALKNADYSHLPPRAMSGREYEEWKFARESEAYLQKLRDSVVIPEHEQHAYRQAIYQRKALGQHPLSPPPWKRGK